MSSERSSLHNFEVCKNTSAVGKKNVYTYKQNL